MLYIVLNQDKSHTKCLLLTRGPARGAGRICNKLQVGESLSLTVSCPGVE